LQLSFTFPDNPNKEAEDFLLLPENSSAFNFVKKFFAQNDFSKSPITSLILKGEEASGKSHLLNIFAKENEVEFLTVAEISGLNLANYFVKNKFYIFDKANEINDEELFFHLFNSIFQANAFLVLVINDDFNFKLKDLNSRLKNIPIAEIKNLSLESTKQLLQNHLSRRQIKLSRQVMDFVANNISRNYLAVFEMTKLLEIKVSEKGGALNIGDVRGMIK
jgi:chromosomal replication initiation ATPase DnaA